VERVRSRRRNHRDLRARRAAFHVGSERLVFDVELVDRFQRNREPHVLALHLVKDRRRIDAIQRQVVVVQPVPGESDRPLIAGAGVNRSGNQRGEGRPVSTVDRQLVDLLLLDGRADRGIDAVQLERSLCDAHLLPVPGEVQSDVEGSRLPDFQLDAPKTQEREAVFRDLDAECARRHVRQHVGT
jgi:hypothetical protein